MAKHSGKVSFSEKSSQFFKVYLPDYSSHQLGIPPAFVRYFNGTIPNDAILKDHSGRQWHVCLEKVDGGVFIKKGWQCFASEHSIELGDFLIFKYDGKSLFDVKIFGNNGCQKEDVLGDDMNAICVKKEYETEEEQTCGRRTRASMRKYSEIAPKRIENSGGSFGASRDKSRKIAVMNSRKHRAFKAPEHVAPNNLHFVTAITRSSRYTVYVPKSLLKSYGIKMKPDMMLHDQDGKKWPVKVTYRKDGRIHITGGWAEFQKANKVKIKDKCIFEFILGRGNLSKEMRVQVVRV